jgi:2-polyprenyl-3-methyl-5-hydroxy-6-metoxy-1,4-benzoquinol methylase
MFDYHRRYDYAVCTKCDLVFQTPAPSNEEIASFYPSDYEVYDEESKQKHISNWRKSNLKIHHGYGHLDTHWLLDFICMIFTKKNKQGELSYNPNATLLDIGCGNGRYLEGMKKLGWHVKGVEFNEGAVKVCKSSGLDVHHGDLFSAKLESNSIDIIHLSHGACPEFCVNVG